jgi:hypothetical protein
MLAFVDHAGGRLLTSAYLFDSDTPLSGHVGGVAGVGVVGGAEE